MIWNIKVFEILLYAPDMVFILKNGIEESILFTVATISLGKNLSPILIILVSENPTIIILYFKHIDTAACDSYLIYFCGCTIFPRKI